MADHTEFILNNLYTLDGYRIYFPRHNPSFKNPEFNSAPFRVLIVRLSPLQNIRESITHHFLYQEVRRAIPSAYIDYAFFPNPKNIPVLIKNKIPLFTGIQSLHSISDFDIVLVSNSYSLELFNIPYIFINTDIAPLKSGRIAAGAPIIIMGGSNSLMSQCIISQNGDSFLDALFFGEGEDAVGRIVAAIYEHRERPKIEILEMLESNIRGFFNIRLPLPDTLSTAPPAAPSASAVLTDYPILNTDIENTAKLAISLGCPCFCTFCIEGNTRKPFRPIAPGIVLAKALEVKLKHAPVEFDLLSFNFNMHPGISKLISGLNELAKFVNFKSQRADIIALLPAVLDIEILSGKRNYTIGVEGISDRMRRYLHKSLSEDELLLAVEQIYQKKPRQVKLFFILTGVENESDKKQFKNFIMKIKRMKYDFAPGCRTIMSFSLLVNLPFTPMQFATVIRSQDSIKQIKGDIKRDCETNNFEFRMAQDFEEFQISQHIVLAGFECFDVISGFAGKGGYFDGEHMIGDKFSLLSELRKASGDLLYEEKDENYVFPLEKLNGVLKKSFLFKIYTESKRFEDSGYCLEGRGSCLGCTGSCDHKQPELPDISPDDVSQLAFIMDRKKRPQIVRALVTIKANARFLTPEAKCAFTGGAILERMPSLAMDFLSCRQVQHIPASKGYGSLFGSFLYDFEFVSNSKIFIEELEKGPVDSDLLSISLVPEEDIGNSFRITAKWNDPEEYSFQNCFQSFLLENGMGFSIKKSGGKTYFEVAEKDKKKKIMYAAVLSRDKPGISLEIETGSNFLIIELVKYLFGDAWTEAEVESISGPDSDRSGTKA